MQHLFTSVVLLLTLVVGASGQTTKRAFFIGNSYTYFNNMPAMINSLANANGDTLIHASSTPGGAQLVHQVSSAATLNGIRQGNWDFVVIQEQSQKPSFRPAQVAADVLPYAAQLNDSIVANNACAETVFFMTWGRKNGDQSNCANYTPLCTYAGMQARLRSSYLLMANQNQGICSPVGAAWQVVRDSFPLIELYNADQSHPSYAGSYLAACTFYASLFKKSPVGLSFHGNLSAADAQALQNIAAMVVLDSLPNWSIGAYDAQADFTASVHLAVATFTNNSSYSSQYLWDFGDASPSSTLENPQHTYSSPGTYTTTLIASDSCGNSDTTTQNVVVTTVTEIENLTKSTAELAIYPNPAKNYVTIDYNKAINHIRIVNTLGKEIFSQKNMNIGKNVIHLRTYTRGVYYVQLKLNSGQSISKKLVLQ
ncbi:MAG: Putative secreted protein (Por secretion system target) [uncultured Aureispira sp.]|uniref:Secreted protein (Por secretion system target) n=1 Tax=uncultured Aureispira sp. TaxID=1331704 RepID=A0A6S6RVM1_9BACT|nr:MAG: Putative secreted protein (Por secretion system target) [uncultured Aureispira sp.]